MAAVPGEAPVILNDGRDGQIAALVRAADLVARNAGVPIAVIGGLAVTCRLETAHRATGDVDLVADEDLDAVTTTGATAGDNLVDAGLAVQDTRSASVRLDVGGTKVEIIPTYGITPAEAADVDPDLARLFVVAHRWALESATTTRVLVAGSDAEATIPMATPAALVAMKLHSIQDRSQHAKRASDAWDLYRLLDRCNAGGQVAAAFADAPDGLAALVRSALDRVFRSEVTRTRHWVHGYGEPEWVAILTDAAMDDAATELIDAITG